jgi:hypothetical protein
MERNLIRLIAADEGTAGVRLKPCGKSQYSRYDNLVMGQIYAVSEEQGAFSLCIIHPNSLCRPMASIRFSLPRQSLRCASRPMNVPYNWTEPTTARGTDLIFKDGKGQGTMDSLLIILLIGLMGGIAVGLQGPMASMITQRLGVFEARSLR